MNDYDVLYYSRPDCISCFWRRPKALSMECGIEDSQSEIRLKCHSPFWNLTKNQILLTYSITTDLLRFSFWDVHGQNPCLQRSKYSVTCMLPSGGICTEMEGIFLLSCFLWPEHHCSNLWSHIVLGQVEIQYKPGSKSYRVG